MKILVVEDDQILNKNVTQALEAADYHVMSVFDGSLVERVVRREHFDCIVLDINLPGKNGFDVCRDFRQFNTTTPVLMLTAFNELDDKVQGFDCGADDYLTKPFFMRELLLRIHALTKRTRAQTHRSPSDNILTYADIVVHLATKKVTRNGVEISLTPREFQVLHRLIERPGEIVSKSDLIKEIWGGAFDANTNTIEVYINFLRNKLDKPFNATTIKTKVGFGYYLDAQ